MDTHTTPAHTPADGTQLGDPNGLRVADEQRPEPLHPCACSFVRVDGEKLRCTRTTRRVFAPGHDAQLKSRLVAASLGGRAVLRVGADGNWTEVSVAEAAGEHGFGYQVTNAVVRARRLQAEKDQRKQVRDEQRAANKAAREQARAEAEVARVHKREQAAKLAEDRKQAKAEKAAVKRPVVKAKVGRWEVLGTVAKDGSLSYTTKAGVAKVAKSGNWTPVA